MCFIEIRCGVCFKARVFDYTKLLVKWQLYIYLSLGSAGLQLLFLTTSLQLYRIIRINHSAQCTRGVRGDRTSCQKSSHFTFFVECTYRHHVELDGQFLSLDVLDTAGKVRISSFYPHRVVLSVGQFNHRLQVNLLYYNIYSIASLAIRRYRYWKRKHCRVQFKSFHWLSLHGIWALYHDLQGRAVAENAD